MFGYFFSDFIDVWLSYQKAGKLMRPMLKLPSYKVPYGS